MAEGKSDVMKALKKLEQEIMCGICKKHYQEPKLLPCGHCFCKECISKLSNKLSFSPHIVPWEPVYCPECEVKVDVDDLKTAFNINRLKDTYASLYEAYEKDVARSKATVGEELKTCSKKCEKHGDFFLLYCYDCEHLICRDCGLSDHKSHKFEYNSEAVSKKKEELRQSTKVFKKVEDDFKKAILEVKAASEKIESQKKSVEGFLQTYFDQLHAILEKNKEQLLKKNREDADRKLANLKAQETTLSDACVDLCSTIENIEKQMCSLSDADLLGIFSNLSKEISKKKDIYSQKNLSKFKTQSKQFCLSPQEDMVMDVNVMVKAEFTTFCEGLARWENLAMWHDEVKCHELQNTVFVGSENSFLLYSQKQGPFECRIRHPRSEKVISCTISQLSPCKYRVNFIAPQASGQYTLQILIDGIVVSETKLIIKEHSPPHQVMLQSTYRQERFSLFEERNYQHRW